MSLSMTSPDKRMFIILYLRSDCLSQRMEPSSCHFNRHLGWQQGCRVLQRLGVIKRRKDSRAMMEVVGTVGRYRGRQAFMNTDFEFTRGICEEITFTIDFFTVCNKGRFRSGSLYA